MAGISGEVAALFTKQVHDAEAKGASNFRANLIVSVATLRLLIGKGIITSDEAIEQISAVQQDFPDVFDREDVAKRLTWAIDLLRGETPLHGSIIDQGIQAEVRKKKTAPA